jgi:hypothetical protein
MQLHEENNVEQNSLNKEPNKYQGTNIYALGNKKIIGTNSI